MTSDRSLRFPLLVIGEWLMTLPAAVFVVAAVLRLLQPREYEPARTAWAIVEWTAAHVSHGDAAVIFLALPAAALVLGLVTLVRVWRTEANFREDAKAALAMLRRRLGPLLLTLGTGLAATLLVLALRQIIFD